VAGQAGLPAPAIQPGQLLSGRYRLERQRAGTSVSQLWRATDEVLARTVAVRTVALAGAPVAADTVAAAVARAGAVSDPRLVRVLDFDTAPDGDFCFVVTEWLDQPTFAVALHDGPLAAAEATDVAWQVADALAAAARRGAGHGRLHPGNVFLTPAGDVRVTDLELARVLAGSAADPEQVQHSDARHVGALLYAGLTGYWPLPGAAGLPAAPRGGDGRPYRPRQVSAGVSREVDDLAVRLLTAAPGSAGAPDTPARAAGALHLLPRVRRDLERPPALGPAGPGPVRRWAWRVVPPVILLAVLFAAYAVGQAVGRVPAPAQAIPTFTAPKLGPSGAPLHQLPVAGVSVFNPFGHDPEDVPGAQLAVDGDLSTAWYTFRYVGNPVFGGLKPGVGLLVDLGSARAVREIHIALSYPGADVQVLAGPARAGSLAGYTVVGGRNDTPRTFFVVPARPLTDRYWLLWLTRLPQLAGGYYQEGVAEIAFFG
jgi:hypothetical protein